MALAIPSPDAAISGPEWRQFLLMLGQPVESPGWYPGLKTLADANGITIPSPAEPLARNGKISTAWYPALQRLAAAI
jgi:hypothetical protein